MFQQQLNCPDCGHTINFDVNALLRGESFSCGHCDAKISLAPKDKATVEASLDALEKLKSKTKNPKL